MDGAEGGEMNWLLGGILIAQIVTAALLFVLVATVQRRGGDL